MSGRAASHKKFNSSCSVNPDELLLRMGEFDLNDEEHEPFTFQDRKVQIVASHPKFDPKTFEYDLALLRYVARPMTVWSKTALAGFTSQWFSRRTSFQCAFQKTTRTWWGGMLG